MSRIYNPYVKITDYSFEIESPELIKMIMTKANLDSDSKLTMTAYLLGDQKAIQIDDQGKLSNEIKQRIKNEIKNKALFHWGLTLKEWLKDYVFEEQRKNWFIYKDETGLKDVAEIRIKFLNKSLQIIEKKPIGTTQTKYKYEIKPWSNDQLILNEVQQDVYEGRQSMKIVSKVVYGEIDTVGQVPIRIDVTSLQKLSMGSTEKVERTIQEKYFFKNFQIQKNSAKRWFNSSK